jgi:hypothetical protein
MLLARRNRVVVAAEDLVSGPQRPETMVRILMGLYGPW